MNDPGTRFWSKVDRSGGDDACWEWAAGRTSSGYGSFRHRGSSVRAHRLAYEVLVGPIPDGLVIDHLCRNKACVNPAHLEVVTHRENTLRGNGASARCARNTHCPQGHPYDEENTLRQAPKYERRCRECARVHRRLTTGRRQMGERVLPMRPSKRRAEEGKG